MEKLFFINENILERLAAGRFVAERRPKSPSITLADRRDTLSPLAIGKRCIRYEPRVFYNRADLILSIARQLNNPEQKMILVTGPQGAGKTSLARGVVEMMGGGPEQLLWFDINVHTDFEEITQFLIQYITYISTALSLNDESAVETTENGPLNALTAGSAPAEESALASLEQHLLRVSQLPLLIVIDNVEFIVDPEYQIQSFSFKEILNFLLSFPNIKMVLLGERLPYADLSPARDVITEVKLDGLSEEAGLAVLQSRLDLKSMDGAIFPSLVHQVGGMPWMLGALNALARRGLSLQTLAERPTQGGEGFLEAIVQLVFEEGLTTEEKNLIQLLACLRHPVDLKTLLAMIQVCQPHLSPTLGIELDKSLIKPFLKRIFPPQVVLRQVRRQLDSHQPVHSPDPWFEIFHHKLKRILYGGLAEEDRLRFHTHLQEFYLKERNLPFHQRIYRVRSKALMAEAAFHSQMARKRKTPAKAEGSVESRAYLYRGSNLPPYTDKKLISEEIHASQSADLDEKGGENSLVLRAEEIPLSAEEAALLKAEMDPIYPLVPPGPAPEITVRLVADSSGVRPGDWVVPVSPQFLANAPALHPWAPSQGSNPPSTASRTFALPSASQDSHTEMFSEMAEFLETDRLASELAPEAMALPSSSSETAESSEILDFPSLDDVMREEVPAADTTLRHPQEVSRAGGARPSGDPDVVERGLQKQLAEAVANRDKAAMALRLLDLARHRATQGLFQNAEECLTKAISLGDEISPVRRGEIYGVLGSVYRETYRHSKATAALFKALNLLEGASPAAHTDMPEPSPPSGPESVAQINCKAQIYLDLGEIAAYRSQDPEAIEYFLKAFKGFAQGAYLPRQAEAAFRLAEVYDRTGAFDQAIHSYEQALRLERGLGNELSCAAILVNMGCIFLEEKQYTAAINCLSQSLGYDRQLGNLGGQIKTLELLASAYRHQQEWRSAEEMYRQAWALARKANHPLWIATSLLNLGNLYSTLKLWPKALDCYQAVLSSAPEEFPEKTRLFVIRKIQEIQSYV